MLGMHDLLLFVGSVLLLDFTPGPDTLYIVGRSTTQGLRAAVVKWFNRCGGGIFVALGIRLALAQEN
jgi:threonine/homoserine/homoserine lactone efflux protein